MRLYPTAAANVVTIFLSVATSSADPIIYATADNGRVLIKVDGTSGEVEIVGPIGQLGSNLLAFGPDGKLYTITNSMHGIDPDPNNQLATFDLSNAKLSLIGEPFGKAIRAWAMGFSSDGAIYASSVDDNMLYRIEPQNGDLTEIGILSGGENLMDLAVRPSDGQMFAVGFGGVLYALDPTTAQLKKIGDITKGHPDIMGIAFDQDGSLFALNYHYQTWLYKLDPASAVATKVADVPAARNVHAADIAPAAK